MIDAQKFARPSMPDKGGRQFGFSVGKDESIAALQTFIKAIEDGEILLQKVQSGVIASIDDYAGQAIYIEFVECR